MTCPLLFPYDCSITVMSETLVQVRLFSCSGKRCSWSSLGGLWLSAPNAMVSRSGKSLKGKGNGQGLHEASRLTLLQSVFWGSETCSPFESQEAFAVQILPSVHLHRPRFSFQRLAFCPKWPLLL